MRDQVISVREQQELLVGQAFLVCWEEVYSGNAGRSLLFRSDVLSVDILRWRLRYGNTFGETVHISIVGVELDLVADHIAILNFIRESLDDEIVLEACLPLHIVNVFCAVKENHRVCVF